MNTGPLAGFYGKLPALGDFVSRRLPRAFVEPWDAWLQDCLTCSRQQLGDDWLEFYLTSPIWRFVLSPGVCGAQAWAGAMMPSVDGVGRYFPLTVTMAPGAQQNALRIIADGDSWFQHAEAELLTALDDDGFEIEAFDRRVGALGAELPHAGAHDAAIAPPVIGMPWRVSLDDGADAGEQLPNLLPALLSANYGRYSVWWTSGSDYLRPSLLVCTALPSAAQFTALLVGDWQRYGWHDASQEDAASATLAADGDAA